MTFARLLTIAEANALSTAAEHWLRLRDVEINLGEVALEVLRAATMRMADCPRQDIASVNWTVDAKLPGTNNPVSLTLVCPTAEYLRSGQVSLLSALGLALIGHALGAVARLPISREQNVNARLVAIRPCPELITSGGPKAA
jgi:transcription elongation GreA/GreB family factor